MKGLRVLVAGGAGYIGSVVASKLLEAGHQVVVVDNLSRGHRDAVPPQAAFVKLELLDRDAVLGVLRNGFDAVLHFAALSLVGESMQHPALYFRTNIVGTLNLLEAMRATGVRRFVFSSTAAVYGEPEEWHITEDAPTLPTNPYGASKLAVDHVIGFECDAGDLGAVSLRYFNVAGASGGLSERHDPETHLIPLVLRAAQRPGTPLQVFGGDYPTPDGTAVRDYVHVDDLASAHLLALAATDRPGHRIYNLGNGAGYSVREVLEAARAVTGCELPSVEVERRPGDPAKLVASSDRIREELGWEPTKPDLKIMIQDAWDVLRADATNG